MDPDRPRAFRLDRVAGALAEVTSIDALIAALTLHLREYDCGAEVMLALGQTYGNRSLEALKQHPGFQSARDGRMGVFEEGAGCIALVPVKAHGAVMGVLALRLGDTPAGTLDTAAMEALGVQTALVSKSLEKTVEAADMARLARIDALTDLPNRRAFEERFEMEWQRAIRSGSPLAVVIIDVDFFGAYNERYGHPAGDSCLQTVARALAAEMRRPEDFLGRYGGEEFVALLPGCGEPDAVNHAERMAASLRGAQIAHEATSLGIVTASFGVAVKIPEDNAFAPGLLDAADASLYCAKEQGRNRVCAGTSSSESPANNRVYPGAHNLPHYITEFIGRDAVLRRVGERLQTSRLVTLVGPGGIGKTRLAVQSAIPHAAKYSDGALYVDLSVADANNSTASLIAQALQVRESPGQAPAKAILDQLRAANKLLVFDNCETAIEEVAQIADLILTGCPNVRILTTGRESLSLPGEVVIHVEPMEAEEAVSLFVNRARFAHPGEERNIPPGELRTVCERLDHLPFAIELAAAQPFAAVQSSAATGDMPDVAAWRKRGALTRQQSIFNLLDWSYRRLSEPEQRMFRFLSVLAGSFDLADAGAVCGLDRAETANIAASLARKSLISTEPAGRSRMLELTGEYGRAMLREAEEYDDARARHAAHYSAIAARIDQAYVDGDTELASALVRNAGANIYSALDYLFGSKATLNQGAAMAASLALFWEFHGLIRDGMGWIERALLCEPDLEPSVAAKLHYGIAVLSSSLSDAAVLIRHGERALQMYRRLGDDVAAAHTCRVLAIGRMLDGQYDAADALLVESIEVFERIGYLRGIAAAHVNLGVIAMDWKGDFPAAERHFERCLAIYRQGDPGFLLAVALMNLGELAFYRGDFEAAIVHEREASTILRDLKHPYLAIAQGMLGRALTAQNNLEPAFEALRNALDGYRDFESPKFLTAALQSFALWLRARGRVEDAVRLLGFIDAYRVRENIRAASAGEPADAELRSQLAASLGVAQYAALYSEGAAADLSTAYRYCYPDSPAIAS